MVTYRLVLLGMCAAAPAGLWALNVKRQDQTPGAQQAIYSFNGEMGIVCGDSGIVREVIFNKSAHTKDIRTGDRIVYVGSNPFSKERLSTAQNSGSDYDVTVRKAYYADGHGEGSLGDECWAKCKGTPGYCGWCGDGNACCKRDWAEDPSECQRVSTWYSNDDGHASEQPWLSSWKCVEVPPSWDKWKYSKLAENVKPVVWVSGYPRSGSSLLLSMVSATVGSDNRAGGHTFSLFEPCHVGDVLEEALEKHGCRQLLYNVAHCDFTGIKQLWGWKDSHSSNNYTADFDQVTASRMCQKADVIAFKTVDWGHELKHWSWLLATHQDMKVLDLVRDPRAIYASWKTLEPFKSLLAGKMGKRKFYTMGDICDHFVMNINFNHSRVHRVVFEDLMKSPVGVTQEVYRFLGQEFGSRQERWIQESFTTEECNPWETKQSFADCHSWTAEDPRKDEKWRHVLSDDELSYFARSESCQRVALEYNYPPK